MKIIGIKHSRFKPRDSDQEISGCTVYMKEEREGVEGYATEHVFCSDKKLAGYKPQINDNVRVVYNRWGKVDAVELIV